MMAHRIVVQPQACAVHTNTQHTTPSFPRTRPHPSPLLAGEAGADWGVDRAVCLPKAVEAA